MTKLNTEDGEAVEVYDGYPESVERSIDGVQDTEEDS